MLMVINTKEYTQKKNEMKNVTKFLLIGLKINILRKLHLQCVEQDRTFKFNFKKIIYTTIYSPLKRILASCCMLYKLVNRLQQENR